MKYIIMETMDKRKVPIIFPEMIEHCDVAKAFLEIIKGMQVVSLGQLSVNDVTVDDESGMGDALEILSHDYFNNHEIPRGAAN
jgi:hypothetical protein